MLHLLRTPRLYGPSGIEVKESPGRGRGIFAGRDFAKGALIETAPVILLREEDRRYLGTTRLYTYYFVVRNTDYPCAIGLGYASLYNHAPQANAHYRISVKKARIQIRAWRTIRTGEEITINYNGRPDDPSPVWMPSTA